jgi:hypothetical protein
MVNRGMEMEELMKHIEEIKEVNDGRRPLLVVRTGMAGEQFVVLSEKIGSGILKIQKTCKGIIKEVFTKSIVELAEERRHV